MPPTMLQQQPYRVVDERLATQRFPMPQAGEFQKLHVSRQIGFPPSMTHTSPVTQPVETASWMHAVLSAAAPSAKHAPAFPPGSVGSQN